MRYGERGREGRRERGRERERERERVREREIWYKKWLVAKVTNQSEIFPQKVTQLFHIFLHHLLNNM